MTTLTKDAAALITNHPYGNSTLWFLVGSQDLYGPEAIATVTEDARVIVDHLNTAFGLPARIDLRPVLTDSAAIESEIKAAEASDTCLGIICWMHTFSPARMWIRGLASLRKPMLQFHTQMHRDIPWATIDMDYMNLHQTAHGGREFGHIAARMRLERKVVVGHWTAREPVDQVDMWIRAAAGMADARRATIVRFGDNMRRVAVTEGDKVEAEIVLGAAVDGHGVGDLAVVVANIEDPEIDQLVTEYADVYTVDPALLPTGDRHPSLREAAAIELGLRRFLLDGDHQGFTTNFEDLHGLAQLPGIAVQRLMADGYGFGAEGDWKSAVLGRMMKVMGRGLPGGTSFMEDYTYHFEPGRHRVLGAHMLEVCPTIAADRPRVEIHPLSIGGKDDPVRLVFDAAPGAAVNASIVDLGNRLRMVVNTVDVVSPDEPLPLLPVPRAVWEPHPDLATSAAAWIQAGGSHHTVLSTALETGHLTDLANIVGIECVVINRASTLYDIRHRLRWNDVAGY